MHAGLARCEGTNQRGEPCGSWAKRGSRYCISHDPSDEGRAMKRACVVKGGLNRKWTSTLPTDELEGLQDVKRLAERIIRESRTGELPSPQATAAIQACALWLRVHREQFEERLAAVGPDRIQLTWPFEVEKGGPKLLEADYEQLEEEPEGDVLVRDD